jgi:hypothetical protein
MKIYKITADANEYQWVMPKNEKSLLAELAFDCISKQEVWQPLDMYIFNPKKRKGNFYSLGGIGALVFDKSTLDSMLTQFEMAGEILNINVGNEGLYTLNVLECINALDENRTKWKLYENGARGRILEYAFYINRLPESSIFKIPETSKTEIFTYSGIKDPLDEFYHLYMQHDMQGLVFEEVYSQ